MTYAELYTLANQLNSDITIPPTLFDQFLDVAQMQIEDIRPWVYLRASNSSQTVGPATSWTTPLTLASDFKEFCEESPLQLINVDNNDLSLTEVPYDERFKYRNSGGRFCVDYKNKRFYLLGTITEAYTVYQNYIGLPALVSNQVDQWVFPERFQKILAFMVAIFYRKGIDYDLFNQTLADNQAAIVRGILDVMTRWDSNLQYSMQRGKDPFNSQTIGMGSTSGGQIQM